MIIPLCLAMPLPPHYPVGEILADKPKKKRIRKKKKPVEPTTPTEPDTTQQTIDKILGRKNVWIFLVILYIMPCIPWPREAHMCS